MNVATRTRPFRFACTAGGHTTGDLTVCDWWSDRPRRRSYYDPTVYDRCHLHHVLELNVEGEWKPLGEAWTPGLTDDVEIDGRRLSAYRFHGPTYTIGKGYRVCRTHLTDKPVGWVVRRTVVDGVELRDPDGYSWRGYDVAAFTATRRESYETAARHAKPFRTDRNNWAVIDELHRCGHRHTQP